MEERLRQLFAIYGSNGTEFSYVIFTKQRNFTMAESRNGSGRTATEWWKMGVKLLLHIWSAVVYTPHCHLAAVSVLCARAAAGYLACEGHAIC